MQQGSDESGDQQGAFQVSTELAALANAYLATLVQYCGMIRNTRCLPSFNNQVVGMLHPARDLRKERFERLSLLQFWVGTNAAMINEMLLLIFMSSAGTEGDRHPLQTLWAILFEVIPAFGSAHLVWFVVVHNGGLKEWPWCLPALAGLYTIWSAFCIMDALTWLGRFPESFIPALLDLLYGTVLGYTGVYMLLVSVPFPSRVHNAEPMQHVQTKGSPNPDS